MVIPKTFEDSGDFGSLILTSVLGTLTALDKDLISLEQAESYWFSPFTRDIFRQLGMSDQLIGIIDDGIILKSLYSQEDMFRKELADLITRTEQLIETHYTNYNEFDALVS